MAFVPPCLELSLSVDRQALQLAYQLVKKGACNVIFHQEFDRKQQNRRKSIL